MNTGGSLLIQLSDDAPTWYACGRQTPGRDDTLTSHPSTLKVAESRDLVAQYRSQADELYKREVANFSQNNTSSDEQWVENTMKRGTLKDRIAAMSVVVSTNPVHKLYALDGLLAMATNPNARMAQMAAEALEDLFLRTLLPPHRKLLSLNQRPLHLYQDANKTLSPRILLLWRYEEMLKEKYQTFLSQYLLHTLQNGQLEVNKLSALRTASALLQQVPEGEAQVLGMLVNKLGDPSKKIAAAAGHQLRQVLDQHVNMQVVIAREVQQLAHRPHLSPRALYNCIIFLNQLELTAAEPTSKQKDTDKKRPNSKAPQQPTSLPASLINTYFCLFEVAVQKDKENSDGEGIKSRLLSALLTGVNRAHPYLPEKDKDLEEHMDSLYRVVHTGPPSASTQALMLLFHVAVGSQQDTAKEASGEAKARQDRFYRALYSTLAQTSIVGGGKHLTMYFNLLYKAMKNDSNTTRVNAFAKRLLCTTMHTSPPVTAASLFLLNEIMKTQEELKSCFVNVAEGESAMAVLDASKREPMAALVHGGESVAYAHLWESTLIRNHYHPSVSRFAAGDIEYTGDPLKDFSLAPFLDKFAYKNPKADKGKRGESVAERRNRAAGKEAALPVNDPSFLQKQDVDVQEEFFHKFFVERARRDEMKGVVRGRSNADEEEDEAFDIAEKFNTDQTFEEAWETDSEEEAFVDSLAEKLIEDAAEAEVDLDDEDPDMEGWDDMYEDDDNTQDGDEREAADSDPEDEDVFMDKMDDTSGEEDSDEPQFGGDGDVVFEDDAFMDASDDDSDSDDEDEPTFKEADNPFNDDASEDDLALIAQSDSEEDEELVSSVSKKKQKSKQGDAEADTFADASAYEEMISKGWEEMKKTRPLNNEFDEGGAPPQERSSSRKKRKRRPKKKRA